MSHNFNHQRDVTGSQASTPVVNEEEEQHLQRTTQPVSLSAAHPESRDAQPSLNA